MLADWDEAKIKAKNFNNRALNALFITVTNEEFKKISLTETAKEALFSFVFFLFFFPYKKIKKIEKSENTKTVCVLCTLILVYLGWPLKQNFLNFVSLVS